jgi:predicted RNA-binding Zn-ribbon protein involved in translation (DUF1610 family)
MPELKVICDACLQSLGISAVTMAATGALALTGPGMEIPLGDCYQCEGCRRIYSPELGYFDHEPGKGMKRKRISPRCNSVELSPMYVKERVDEKSAIFKCPKCGQERKEEFAAHPLVP